MPTDPQLLGAVHLSRGHGPGWGFLLCLVLLALGCGGRPAPASPTPPPAAVPAFTPTPLATVAPLADLLPGPLEVTKGPQVTPQDPVLSLQARMEQGDFMLGLRPAVAPGCVARIEELVKLGAFQSSTLDLSKSDLVILPADAGAVAKLASPPVAEKNRIAPAPGLLFFDGRSKLAMTLGAAKLAPDWVCVGQVQIAGPVLQAWKEGSPPARRLVYFGNLVN